jgi:hypothetical protein
MKLETGKELKKEEQTGRQEPSMAISSQVIVLPFARVFLPLKCFVLYGGL